MRAKVPGNTLCGRPPGRWSPPNDPIQGNTHSTTRSSIPIGLAGSGGCCAGPDRLSVARPPRGFVPATEGSEEFVERRTERVSEGVPCLEGADGATLLDLDESPSGQAAPGCQFVVRPSPRRTQPSQLQTQSVEVRIGREDRHPTIRRCRPLPCQCRLLPYFRSSRRGAGQSSALPCAADPSPTGTGAKGQERRAP